MNDNFPLLISAGALLLAVVNAWYGRRKDVQGEWKEEFKELTHKMEGVTNRLIVAETQITIFFKGVSFSSAHALHSPHTKELDALLEKFQRDEIQNEKDLQRLKDLLKGIAKEDPDSVRQKFALDILTLIHVRFEIGGDLIDSLRKQNQSVDHSLRNFSARLK